MNRPLRKYSLTEIDSMRASLRMLYHISQQNGFSEESMTKVVEEQLRTHMFNGTTVDELSKHASKLTQEKIDRDLADQKMLQTRRDNRDRISRGQ